MNTVIKHGSHYARSLIEASLDPLFTISPDGKITDINNASVTITESTREKLIGTDFFDYFTEPAKARDIYKQVFQEGFVADFPLTIRDGKLTEVLFNGSVYKDEAGKVLGVVVVARDITDHKRIENELTRSKENAESALRIAEKAQKKAEQATLVAENAVRSKQQFLSNMSHEIRTPMNAIIGFTKVLLNTDISCKQKEYLNAIKTSGEALTVLINDILDLAKVDAGKMIFEQIAFKLSTSISAMIHLFETKIQEKNLILTKNYDKNIPKVIIGDPVRLHQIILNLVGNAVKFTAKGEISVDVKLLSEDEAKVEIEFSVTDTGIGIPENKVGHIFENFQQASSDTGRLFGGTGLGLAIAKQLVESQGGKISVKSKLNEGSTFSFILPFQKTGALPEEEKEITSSDLKVKNLKVLVVEDIALNQLLMKTLLDEFGFENDIAANGKIAIEMLQKKAYDVVLMDLQMPEMNGYEATVFIRDKMKLLIPIIALTADVTTVDLQKCKASGMDDYISKPIDEKLLFRKLNDLFNKPVPAKKTRNIANNVNPGKVTRGRTRYVDLTFLYKRTKSNPELMMEMINLYLEQTGPLVNKMKQSLADRDWCSLYSAAHKVIPSFSIMGIHKKYEDITKQIQEFAGKREHPDKIEELVDQIETVCTQACEELREESNIIMRPIR